MQFIKRHKVIITLTAIFILTFALRFYKLGDIPYGFYQDESSIGYNAYSILESGKDEYGKNFPLYFKSFGDYKLPVYIYLTSISISIFGMTEFAVRFPSAFFGSLTVIVFFLFSKELTRRDGLSLLASFIYAINPWALHYNRATFEVSISLFLFLLGSYLLFYSIRSRKGILFIFGTIFFVIALYTYNLTRLLAPLIFIVILIWNYKSIKNIKFIYLIIAAVISCILLTPFAISLFDPEGISSASGTLIFSSSFTKAPQIELRSYILDSSPLISKLFFNSYILSFLEYIKNLVRYLDFNFFFVTGSTHGNHGMNVVGQFHLFESITLLIGSICAILSKKRWVLFLFLWAFIVVAVCALTREAPHATRSFFLVPALILISSFGIIKIVELFKSSKKRVLSSSILVSLLVFAIINVIYYFSSYYFYFPSSYARSWRSEDKSVALYLKEIDSNYDKVVFDNQSGFVYSSLLFYYPESTDDFNKEVIRLPDDSEGFSKVISFGKYEFRDVDWSKDLDTNEKTLIITSPNQAPVELPKKQQFYYPRRYVVSPIGQDIFQYPVEDVAYVVVESR